MIIPYTIEEDEIINGIKITEFGKVGGPGGASLSRVSDDVTIMRYRGDMGRSGILFLDERMEKSRITRMGVR